MDSVFCFVNTLFIGMMSSAMFYIARDVDRLAQRVAELEEDSMVLDDYEDEDEEVTVSEVEEKKDI